MSPNELTAAIEACETAEQAYGLLAAATRKRAAELCGKAIRQAARKDEAKSMLSPFRYELRICDEHIASFRDFGSANHAAFDDLPGFRAFESALFIGDLLATVRHAGRIVAAYHLSRGRLARPVDALVGTLAGVAP